MLRYQVILATLAAAAMAIPNPTAATDVKAADLIATFDGEDGVALVATSPINDYNSIYWRGCSLVDGSLDSQIPVQGVTPGVSLNTPRNCAAFSRLDAATVEQGEPSMRAEYSGSKTQYFDLHSFYYACVEATQVTTAALARKCTITIRAYDDVNAQHETGMQSFDFDYKITDDGLVTPMLRADVTAAGFKKVKVVRFFVSEDTTKAALMDTFKYTVYRTD